MPVTEFAQLPLIDDYDEVDLLEVLMECQETQDTWVREKLSSSVGTDASVSNVYIDEKTTPPSLLITARWDSPEDHYKWIETDENKAIMDKLARFLKDGKNGMLLYHMTSSGRRAQMQEAFLAKGCLNVWRLAVPPADREELQQAYTTLEETLFNEDNKDKVWGGWRIENNQGKEELTVFWNDQVAEETVAQLDKFPHGEVDRHRYKQIV
jgi:hypothetical protein